MKPVACDSANASDGHEGKLHRVINAFKAAIMDPREGVIDHPEKMPKFDEVRDYVVSLASHDLGCRQLQVAFAGYSTAEHRELAREFQGHVRMAVESQHANHVLQRLVELLPPASLSFLVSELSETWGSSAMARHKFGCRVLERILEHFTCCPSARSELRGFLAGLLGDARELCFHPFGNFVMQHVLEHGTEEQRRVTLQSLRQDLRKAALDEHAVCVLDKALTVMPLADQQILAGELIQEQDLLPLMANLRSGQLAAERLLFAVPHPLLTKLHHRLEMQQEALNASKGGRKFLEALEKRRCSAASVPIAVGVASLKQQS